MWENLLTVLSRKEIFCLGEEKEVIMTSRPQGSWYPGRVAGAPWYNVDIMQEKYKTTDLHQSIRSLADSIQAAISRWVILSPCLGVYIFIGKEEMVPTDAGGGGAQFEKKNRSEM
jgi:hypothetical protein